MTKILKLLLVSFCILTLPRNAMAQLTLDDCQQLANKNYPLISKYDLIKLTTEYDLKNINRKYLPQLGFLAQASIQSDVPTLPDPLVTMLTQYKYDVKGMRNDQYRIALELNQMIWDGGQVSAERKITNLQGDVQALQADADMYAVRDRINNLYFGLLLVEDKIKLLRHVQDLLEANCKKLESMQKSGLVMKSDVNSVKIELIKVQQQQVELSSAKQQLQEMLAIFIGKNADEITSLQKPDPTMPEQITNNRPELLMFDKQLQLMDAQKKLINSSVRPRISLYGQAFYGYPGYDIFDAMFSHKWKLEGVAGLRITWNISNFYTLGNNKRKIELAKNYVQNGRDVFLFNYNVLSTQDVIEIKQYQDVIEKDDEIIALCTSTREAAETKLEKGVIDVHNLLQEILRESQAQLDKSFHEIEMLKRIYELKNTVNQ